MLGRHPVAGRYLVLRQAFKTHQAATSLLAP